METARDDYTRRHLRAANNRRADIMINELLGIQYNIVKANVTNRRVQNLASYINEESFRAVHKTMDKNKARMVLCRGMGNNPHIYQRNLNLPERTECSAKDSDRLVLSYGYR